MTPAPARLDAPRFETRGAMLIAGLRGHYTTANADTIPELWQRFVPYLPVRNAIGTATYGLCFPAAEGFDYQCGVEIPEGASIPAEFVSAAVPAQQYAVFTHRDHISKLRTTIENISQKWFPSSGYHHVEPAQDAPAFFERYDERFNPRTGIGDVEVWMPMQPWKGSK